MALPTGRLSRQQIRDIAARKAGNSGLSNTDAVTYLQLILDDLYQQYEWPFLRTSVVLFIVGSTVPLPKDFLKTVDDAALQTTQIDGLAVVKTIPEVDPQYFAQLQNANAAGGVPEAYTCDRNAEVIRLFPDPSGHAITAQFRYKFQPATQVTDAGALPTEPADVPIFPYHNVLVQALFAMILYYEGDARADTQMALFATMLKNVTATANPRGTLPPDVPLDPLLFRPNWDGD